MCLALSWAGGVRVHLPAGVCFFANKSSNSDSILPTRKKTHDSRANLLNKQIDAYTVGACARRDDGEACKQIWVKSVNNLLCKSVELSHGTERVQLYRWIEGERERQREAHCHILCVIRPKTDVITWNNSHKTAGEKFAMMKPLMDCHRVYNNHWEFSCVFSKRCCKVWRSTEQTGMKKPDLALDT